MPISKRQKILKKLNKEGIPVVLIGAQAVRVFGSSRESYDVDFAARISDMDRIVDIMYAIGYQIPTSGSDEHVTWAVSKKSAKRFIETRKSGTLNFYFLNKKGHAIDQVDFVVENPIPFPRLKQRAITISMNPLLLCACIDDLIIMKKKRIREGRAKPTDHVDLEFLKAKKKERMRIKRGLKPKSKHKSD